MGHKVLTGVQIANADMSNRWVQLPCLPPLMTHIYRYQEASGAWLGRTGFR
ncbi:hypothetical protein NRB_49890 [Novosphingobium sp. 11B]